MKNVLITGDMGYIGSHLKKIIKEVRRDINIQGFDIKGHQSDVTVPSTLASRPGIGDVTWDAVIHLAALVKVGESVKSPISYYETNVNGTINALRFLQYEHFILASTGAASNPTSPYGHSKLMAEQCVQQYCANNSIDSTIFRFYNVIGQDGFNPTNGDGLFYNLKKAVQTKQFNLYGTDYDTKDGTCVREYVHVNDICLAIIRAIDNPANNIENLAYGDTRTVREIIDTFKKTNSVDFEVIEKPRRQGDLKACYLPNPSPYMERNYTYEQMLSI
jgi:UDP-glucose 4-epimerase